MSNEKKMISPITYDAPEKNPEEKEYIILYYVQMDDDVSQCFSRVTGRIETFRNIAQMLLYYEEDVDINKSVVLVETKQTQTKTGNEIYFITHPNDSFTIKNFLNFCYNNGIPEDILKEFPISDNILTNILSVEVEKEEKHSEDNKLWYKEFMNTEDFYSSNNFINQDNNEENNV